jgi:hypothetical protein
MSTRSRLEDGEAERKQDPGFQVAAEEPEPVFQMERLKLLYSLSTAHGKIGQVRELDCCSNYVTMFGAKSIRGLDKQTFSRPFKDRAGNCPSLNLDNLSFR